MASFSGSISIKNQKRVHKERKKYNSSIQICLVLISIIMHISYTFLLWVDNFLLLNNRRRKKESSIARYVLLEETLSFFFPFLSYTGIIRTQIWNRNRRIVRRPVLHRRSPFLVVLAWLITYMHDEVFHMLCSFFFLINLKSDTASRDHWGGEDGCEITWAKGKLKCSFLLSFLEVTSGTIYLEIQFSSENLTRGAYNRQERHFLAGWHLSFERPFLWFIMSCWAMYMAWPLARSIICS